MMHHSLMKDIEAGEDDLDAALNGDAASPLLVSSFWPAGDVEAQYTCRQL